jgi:predicted TIM-barrel fold metal-dependent hydrolase
VAQLLAQLDSDDLLMFSTDYPHWHFETPEQALPVGLSDAARRKILHANARAFYHL